MNDTEIIGEVIDKINSEKKLQINNKFLFISRILSIFIILIILYLSFESFFNSIFLGYEYGGKNNTPLVFLFIPGCLLAGLLGMKTRFGYKMYNTVLIGIFIFYGLMSLGGDNQLINTIEISVAILALINFIYSISKAEFYGLKKTDSLLLKLK